VLGWARVAQTFEFPLRALAVKLAHGKQYFCGGTRASTPATRGCSRRCGIDAGVFDRIGDEVSGGDECVSQLGHDRPSNARRDGQRVRP